MRSSVFFCSATAQATTAWRLFAVACLTAALLGCPGLVRAQTSYPERPVRIIVPFGPGGVGDVITRLVADGLGEKLGQRFVVENFPGAGGMAAAHAALSAPADGYTLMYMASATAMSVNLFAHLSFDPVKDFAPVSSVGYFDLVFLVPANSPYHTLQEVLDVARKKPGELNVGTILPGSTQELAVEVLQSTAKVTFTIVPFHGSGEVLLGLQRNDVQMATEFYAASQAQIAAKTLLPIATSGAKRTSYLPDVPTVQEAGGGDFQVTSWNALFVRTGTPQPIVEKLNAALREVVADPVLRDKARALGVETAGSTADEIGGRLVTEIQKWNAVITKAGLKPH
jgi:tripartite-type tricarboxylate transporter receptor subunit TctC